MSNSTPTPWPRSLYNYSDDAFMTPELEDDIIEAAIKLGEGNFPFTVCWLDDDNEVHYHEIG